LGVRINPYLPVIERIEDVAAGAPKSSQVASRLIALMCTATKALSAPRELVDRLLAIAGTLEIFTADERKFFLDAEPHDEESRKHSWNCEPAYVLAWALRVVEDPMRVPDGQCVASEFAARITERGKLLFDSQLRSPDQLLDAADFIYRLHWTVRDNWLRQLPPPLDVDGGVVFERHRALNWLIGTDSDWDNVDTST
jgi:hypothetical protein